MRKRENKQNHRPILRRFTTWLHGAGAKCALIYAVGTLVLLVLFAAACAPQRYSLSVGAISHQTITATKDVEDTVTTESRRREASVRVEATYHFQEGVTESVLSDLDETFRQLRIVQQYGLTLRVQDGETATETNLAATFSAEEIDYALQQVEAVSLTRYQATVLMRASTENFDTMAVTVRLAVESALNTTIREGQVSQSIAAIKQIAGYRVETSLMQNIVPVVLNHCIRPNMVIDQELTAQAQENAAAQVEPVVYLQGQNIIREGERVQANQLAMLEALGLLDTASYDYDIYLGAAAHRYFHVGADFDARYPCAGGFEGRAPLQRHHGGAGAVRRTVRDCRQADGCLPCPGRDGGNAADYAAECARRHFRHVHHGADCGGA